MPFTYLFCPKNKPQMASSRKHDRCTSFDFITERSSWNFSSKVAFFFPDISSASLLSSLQNTYNIPRRVYNEEFIKDLSRLHIYTRTISGRRCICSPFCLVSSRQYYCSTRCWSIIGVHMIYSECWSILRQRGSTLASLFFLYFCSFCFVHFLVMLGAELLDFHRPHHYLILWSFTTYIIDLVKFSTNCLDNDFMIEATTWQMV